MTNYLRAFYQLNQMNKRTRWTPAQLEAYQQKKLQQIIRYAYSHVPYYRRKFRELNLHPESIKTANDLNKLPILTKKEIKQNLSNFISNEYKIKNLKAVSTSGSTGEPLFLYLSEFEAEFRKAKHLRANISLGQRPRDMWVTLTGPQHLAKTARLQRLAGLYVPVTVSVFDDLQVQISALAKLKPDVLDGYSSSLYVLAREVQRQKIGSIKPRFVIGGAELVDAGSRQLVEDVFGVPFYDQYSSVEFERMAWQCPAREGYHIDADALVLQFLDRNGQEVTTGHNGEVVCTSLFNFAMPLIRYAIGDFGTPTDKVCSCGRCLPLMEMVEGRKDALIVLPNGKMITPRAFTHAVHLFKHYSQIDQFRVIQKKLDLFEFKLKIKNKDSATILERDFLSHMRTTLGFDGSAEFRVDFVDDMPLDKNGKLGIVVSELPSEMKRGGIVSSNQQDVIGACEGGRVE